MIRFFISSAIILSCSPVLATDDEVLLEKIYSSWSLDNSLQISKYIRWRQEVFVRGKADGEIKSYLSKVYEDHKMPPPKDTANEKYINEYCMRIHKGKWIIQKKGYIFVYGKGKIADSTSLVYDDSKLTEYRRVDGRPMVRVITNPCYNSFLEEAIDMPNSISLFGSKCKYIQDIKFDTIEIRKILPRSLLLESSSNTKSSNIYNVKQNRKFDIVGITQKLSGKTVATYESEVDDFSLSPIAKVWTYYFYSEGDLLSSRKSVILEHRELNSNEMDFIVETIDGEIIDDRSQIPPPRRYLLEGNEKLEIPRSQWGTKPVANDLRPSIISTFPKYYVLLFFGLVLSLFSLIFTWRKYFLKSKT